ncbi:MAG: amidohydrolase [Pseudomonadota bacterium]
MPSADIVIENARVLTMDPARPRAEAVAISGARLMAVGPRAAAQDLIGPGTRRIDAGGATVMPGLVEAHLHLFGGAFGMRFLSLEGVQGVDALRAELAPYAAANPDEALLICQAADYNLFGESVMTTRQMLDAALPDRPLILYASDYHTAWANTVALERADILQGRALPPGNEIVMASDGTAAGELRESAASDPVMALRSSGGREKLGLNGVEPGPLSPQERAEDMAVLREGLQLCASYGFTALHNMDGNRYQLDLLSALESQGELLCRTEVPFHLTPEKPISSLEEASQLTADFATERLKSGRIKMFMDGVIDSATAVLVEDYADQPGWRGDPLHSEDRFKAAAIEADRRGLQISVHAIGDGAVRRVLDGYAAARAANGARDSRHRIEHVEVLHPDDLPRFGELGVIASMQPSHPPAAMDFSLEPWVSRVGEARWPWSFPITALKDADVTICFASDWPVADLNPMRSVKAAMTRPKWQASDPDNRMSLMEALYAYSAAGAYAGHDDHRFGRLAPGMLADLVIMDRDLEAAPVETLDQARARLTLCGGAVTWEA